jgi:hypothetical protein
MISLEVFRQDLSKAYCRPSSEGFARTITLSDIALHEFCYPAKENFACTLSPWEKAFNMHLVILGDRILYAFCVHFVILEDSIFMYFVILGESVFSALFSPPGRRAGYLFYHPMRHV